LYHQAPKKDVAFIIKKLNNRSRKCFFTRHLMKSSVLLRILHFELEFTINRFYPDDLKFTRGYTRAREKKGQNKMTIAENNSIEESMKGYKEKIVPITKSTLKWRKDLTFVGTTQQGYEIEFDAHAQEGCKPMEALLLSLAGCMAIDIVMILQKMRGSVTEFRMDLVGERNQTPPQYFKTIEMVLHITGKNLDSTKVDRAISLSHDKYCSVYNSLRNDMDVNVRYVLEESN
jgi:putative redox protein